MKLALRMLLGLAVMLAGIAVPQLVYLATDSAVLSIFLGLVFCVAWVALLVTTGKTFNAGLVGAGVGLLVLIGTPVIGTAKVQVALKLANGKALDGATLHEVLTKGEEDIWVRITDARVRSEASKRLEFVRSSASQPGKPSTQTREWIDVAPVTLAADVPSEDPFSRAKPTGTVQVWACGRDSFELKRWDTERQAVRGRLAKLEEKVKERLNEALRVEPMALGRARLRFRPLPAREQNVPAHEPPKPLHAAEGAWCVHLDASLNAAEAKAAAVSDALVVILSFAVMLTGVAFALARM